MPNVQAIQAGGDARSGPDGASETHRVGKDSFELVIELRGGGWIDAIAHVQNSWGYRTGCSAEGLHFNLVACDALVFHHAPAVLVLQGMTMEQLLAPDTYFFDVVADKKLASGPWVLLKSRLSESWEPPLRLKNVVLAEIKRVPADMSREKMLSLLLDAIL